MNDFNMYGGRKPESVLNDLRDRVHENGGFTVLYEPDSAGRFVIGMRGFTVHSEDFKLRHIEQIAIVAAGTFGAHGFGAWISEGIVYLDVIQSDDNKDSALNLARRYNQLAIFDSVTGASIYLHLTDAG